MSEKRQCCATVYNKALRFPRPTPCSRAAHIERDGKWYCKQHDPIEVDKRTTAKHERSRVAYARWQIEQWKIRTGSLMVELLRQAIDATLSPSAKATARRLVGELDELNRK